MKNTILSFTIIFFTIISYAQKPKKIYFDENWVKVEKKNAAKYYRTIEKDKSSPHSLVKDYQLAGAKLLCEGTYSSLEPEIKHGKFTYYHLNGKKSKGQEFMHGEEDGIREEYYASGDKKAEGHVQKDKKKGLWKYYYPKGAIQKQGKYFDNKKVGVWKYSNPDGKSAAVKEYNQGTLKSFRLASNTEYQIYYEANLDLDAELKKSEKPYIDENAGEEEFKLIEPHIKENIRFIETHPGDKANTRLMEYTVEWINRCPYLEKIKPNNSKIVKDHTELKAYQYTPDMKAAFRIGEAAYAIENQGKTFDANASLTRGMESVAKVYKEIVKSKKGANNPILDRLLSKHKNGDLEDFIKGY